MRAALRHYVGLLVVLSSLASPGFLGSAARPARGGRLSPKNFDVLGVELGSSTVADVERILGPAPSAQSSHIEEAVRCYASLGSDGTVLQFDSWLESVVEFRFFRGSRQSVSRCARSSLVSAGLATASGLRLGMSRDEVIGLLGAPSSKQANRVTYESSYDRPLTPEEIKHYKDVYQTPPVSINVYEKVDLRFRAARVTGVEVTRGKDS